MDRALRRTTMDDNREKLSRIETVFGSAIEQTRGCGVNINQVTIDAHVDHVDILVGGHSKALFKVNAEGSIRGPLLGFHDPIGLGSINDDGVEFNIAWAVKNELLDEIKPQQIR
jgi:hypothetical protein